MQIKKIFEQLNPKKIVLSNIYQNISLLLFPRPTDILMHNPNLYIDKTFFDRCLKGKWLAGIRYGRVKTGQFKRQIDKKIYLLKDLPLYQRLIQQDKENSNHEFKKLINSIQTNGFNPESVIICKYRSNLIKDGQHRAMYLLWRYGDDYEVNTIHIRVKNTLLRHKIFPWLNRKSQK